MKSSLCIITLLGLAVSTTVGFAQTNSQAGDAPAAAVPAATNAVTAPAAPAAEATLASPAVAVIPLQPGAIIPLIIMDDVPLTDAIRNLARQAGLNYMLDPRISFGQSGADGKPIAQPSVSIRWENVTASQALQALLNNYSLQTVEDPKSRIARVTVKDPAAPDPLVSKIFQLKYSGPSNILASVQSTLTDKRSRVVADVRTSQLVVVATEKELDDVGQLIQRLDTQTKQVLIEARLIETSINPSSVKGIDWTGTLQNQNIAMGNNLQTSPVSSGDSVNRPLSSLWPKMMFDSSKGFNPATAFLDADGVSAVLHFLNTYSEANVLSCPRTVTLDNEPATISVVRASPIFNITAGTANTTGGSQTAYTNLGVILNVTPRISADNFVNLKVSPEVSRVFDTVTKTLGGETYQADEYDLRRIDTHVMIPSGNTLVLGGLVQDDVRKGNTKIPVLGDIPILGYAFRSDTKSRQKNNLLIFITPTIVQDSDYQPTKSTFLNTPVPLKDSVEPDWGPWNSGKPKDWSKPKNPDVKAAQDPIPDQSSQFTEPPK
jgi:type II secretory pathway component GspD/PulD (secretin)